MKNIILAILASLCLYMPVANAQTEFYRKHYVIVVDQGVIQTHNNTPQLFRDIKELFVDNKPLTEIHNDESIPYFDSEKDQISLFASGFIRNSDYDRMFNGCIRRDYKEDEIVPMLVDHLFHKVEDFQSSGLSLEEYLNHYLLPLMNKDWKRNNVGNQDLFGFNSYLYPLVLNKLDSDSIRPAENYYFIIISNFTAQGQVHAVRNTQAEPLLKSYLTSLDNNYNYWISNFYTNIFTDTHTTRYPVDRNNPNNEPKVHYFRLGVQALEKVSLSVQSSPEFDQEELHGKIFDMTSSTLVFNHPQSLSVTDVWVDVEINRILDTVINYTLGEDVRTDYDGQLLTYKFDGKKVDLGELKPSDVVATKYHFSSKIMENDKSLLPMNFAVSSSYTLKERNFIPEPEVIPAWMQWCIAIITIIILFILFYFIRKKRGEIIKAEISYRFIPVSREKYMDVSNMVVKEYDCWYMNPEAERTSVKFEVCGNLKTIKKSFSEDQYRVRLEFKVEDIDRDDNFTFKPRGWDDNGREYVAGEWYRVEVDPNGEFSIPIIAYLDIEKHPELRQIDDLFWHEDHILKVQLDFRAFQVNKHDEPLLNAKKCDGRIAGKNLWATYPSGIYEFIARPTFNLRDSWVAFDPGTSGACAAFITGGNIDTPNNIHIVNELVRINNEDVYEPVFPSKICITDHAKVFKSLRFGDEIKDVSLWEECQEERDRKDFIFGWRAYRMVAKNSFQSIKKLLGYTDTQLITDNTAKELHINGKLLAQLLVKGLYAHTERYIVDLYNNPGKFNGKIPNQPDPIDIGNHYFENGKFSPQKAIVAVPNNYTLPKIQDMVDTVKALGQFREVHYIYESEGILMEYCHQNWHQLDSKANKLFVVFDMGGATINATAFRLTDVKKDVHNNIINITLDTVGKIGYCVGGDDIDYAIIRQIYEISAINTLYNNSDADIKHHMATHKQLLIKLARELKLAIIAKHNDKAGILDSKESFSLHLMSYAKDMNWGEELVFGDTDLDLWLDTSKLCNDSKTLQTIVYNKIEDSVKELFASMSALYKGMPIEIIFGGRSTLFPFVRETVKKAMPSTATVWNGFGNDENAVKTAVTSGACWYANFSQHITIKHNIITTAFGYLDTKGGQEVFVPMIDAGEKFETEKIQRSRRPYAPDLLNEITFVQMQGADYEQILSDFRNSSENKHKMNILDIVAVDSTIKEISITLDEKLNFGYAIETAHAEEDITQNNYPLSRLRLGTTVKTEIADENNESYMFAAISSPIDTKDEQSEIRKIKKRIP